MPFDPTLPLASSQVNSAELRNQFNGLKDLIDSMQQQLDDLIPRVTSLESSVAALQAQAPNWLTQSDMEPLAADNIDSVAELSLTVSNPPTTAEVEQIVDKLNEAISELHR